MPFVFCFRSSPPPLPLVRGDLAQLELLDSIPGRCLDVVLGRIGELRHGCSGLLAAVLVREHKAVDVLAEGAGRNGLAPVLAGSEDPDEHTQHLPGHGRRVLAGQLGPVVADIVCGKARRRLELGEDGVDEVGGPRQRRLLRVGKVERSVVVVPGHDPFQVLHGHAPGLEQGHTTTFGTFTPVRVCQLLDDVAVCV